MRQPRYNNRVVCICLLNPVTCGVLKSERQVQLDFSSPAVGNAKKQLCRRKKSKFFDSQATKGPCESKVPVSKIVGRRFFGNDGFHDAKFSVVIESLGGCTIWRAKNSRSEDHKAT